MKSNLETLWYVEVVFSTVRFLVSPDAYLLSRLTLVFGLLYTFMYVQEIKVVLKLLLFAMKKFPIIPFLIILDYGIARRVNSRIRFTVEFVILWGRFFMAPHAPELGQRSWTNECERTLNRILDDLYNIGKDFNAWRCIASVTPAIATQFAAKNEAPNIHPRYWYDHLVGPRLWLTLAITLVSVMVYKGNGKSIFSMILA